MPRLLGVDIPGEQADGDSLSYLYGVGPKIARELCHKAGVDPQARAKDLREDELARLAALLDKDYMVEGQLRRQISPEHRPAARHRLLSRASAIAAGCRSAASGRGPTPGPARGRRRRSPARRA